MRGSIAIAVVALCSVFAVSCASFRSGAESNELNELRSEITVTVADAARRQEMLKAVDRMVASIDELSKVNQRQREQINAQIRDYSTTRKALETTLANDLKTQQAIIDNLTKAHYDFKSQATAKEWKKLAKKEEKVLDWVVQNSLEGGA
jgi:hypothetical protein